MLNDITSRFGILTPTRTLSRYIDTPGERERATDAELTAAGRDVPWGRLGTPADIGNSAVRWRKDHHMYHDCVQR